MFEIALVRFRFLINLIADPNLVAPQGGGGGGAAPPPGDVVAGPIDPMGGVTNILMIVVFLGLIVFMLFVQPRKAAKKKKEMLDALKVGDMVITTSGFYGRIVEDNDDCFVLEFGDPRGVRIPVRKEAVEGGKPKADDVKKS